MPTMLPEVTMSSQSVTDRLISTSLQSSTIMASLEALTTVEPSKTPIIIPILPSIPLNPQSPESNQNLTLHESDDPGEQTELISELKKQLKISIEASDNSSKIILPEEIEAPKTLEVKSDSEQANDDYAQSYDYEAEDDVSATKSSADQVEQMRDMYHDETLEEELKKTSKKKRELTGNEWGVMIPGACLKGCAFGFYLFSIVSSIINCFGASGRIGNLLVNYR